MPINKKGFPSLTLSPHDPCHDDPTDVFDFPPLFVICAIFWIVVCCLLHFIRRSRRLSGPHSHRSTVTRTLHTGGRRRRCGGVGVDIHLTLLCVCVWKKWFRFVSKYRCCMGLERTTPSISWRACDHHFSSCLDCLLITYTSNNGTYTYTGTTRRKQKR